MRGAQLLERSDELRASAARSVKRHRGVPTVSLPRPELAGVTLADALAGRRSLRSYGPRKLELAELATLLGAAYGVTGAFEGAEQAVRTVPSGGALYPLELYVADGASRGSTRPSTTTTRSDTCSSCWSRSTSRAPSGT